MQAAFLTVFVLPPPAAGADVLTWSDGACARLASDGWKPARVQRVHWNGIVGDISFEPFQAPIRQRVEFHEAIFRVP